MQFSSTIIFAVVLATSASTYANDYKLGELQIDHPYARTTVANQPSGAAYMTIENKGKNADKLLSVATPVAKTVEIHTMSMDGNVMKMREVANIELKPSAKVSMKPGDGYHVMLIGLKQQLKAGDNFPLTLSFEKSGKLEVSVTVEDKDAKTADEGHVHVK
jgi:copper(I)-binding protein